ncbi:hypothetical protein HPO96_01470 [Kribbella sandramycini]|uniref:Uncharacterized protein n=1 Tax=Kribbella sandramycini TaxID=60450 RepID=A0A7Y4KUR9_9ACTN|nr:hypothetical protein [Kribbella sandramycini]MBB6568507.1 hypothetical protein [Kribbella sandramycini]NOL38905.1 hypothetical protein [Kribbella sandramycini]
MLVVSSDSGYVEEAFAWARDQALAWVRTGPGNLPSYWAGYPSRELFYLRDVAHQAAGAHLLGLDAENFAMFRHFARSATPARKWFPLWAFHFDGRIAALDHHSDEHFVREIPAVFDLTYRALEQYDWTGDRRWLDDPDLAAYYRTCVGEFVTAHDSDGDGVPEAGGTADIFLGTATYNEREAPLLIAGDGLAAQYAVLRKLGRDAEADRLQAIYQTWWRDDHFARGVTTDGLDFDWGLESHTLAALFGLGGTDQHLDWLEAKMTSDPPKNIESKSYYPELLFKYGRDESAWQWTKHLIDSRDDYPEISFTVVEHLVAGLLGLRPRAGDAVLAVDSHLPAELGVLTADHIRVGGWDLRITQEARHTTEVTVHSGPGPLTVVVAGTPHLLGPGETARVSTPTKDRS